MRALDWLFGVGEVGWAKTALLSMLLGFPLFFALYQPVSVQSGSARFVVIALGYPLLALVRRLYWGWRERQIASFVSSGDSRLEASMTSIARWQPQLHLKYFIKSAAARERREATRQPQSPGKASCPFCGASILATMIMCADCAAKEVLKS